MGWSYHSQTADDSVGSTPQNDVVLKYPVIVLPITDPHVAGALWNNNGELEISEG